MKFPHLVGECYSEFTSGLNTFISIKYGKELGSAGFEVKAEMSTAVDKTLAVGQRIFITVESRLE